MAISSFSPGHFICTFPNRRWVDNFNYFHLLSPQIKCFCFFFNIISSTAELDRLTYSKWFSLYYLRKLENWYHNFTDVKMRHGKVKCHSKQNALVRLYMEYWANRQKSSIESIGEVENLFYSRGLSCISWGQKRLRGNMIDLCKYAKR